MYSQLLALYLTLNGRLLSCFSIVLFIGTFGFVVYRLVRWTTARSERDFFVSLVLCMLSAFLVSGHLNRFSSLLYLSGLPPQRVDFYQDPVKGIIVISERAGVRDYRYHRNVFLHHLKLDPQSFMVLWPAARSLYIPERPRMGGPLPPVPPDILL